MNPEPKYDQLMNNVMLFEEIVLPTLYRNNSNVDRTMIGERSNQYYNPNQ